MKSLVADLTRPTNQTTVRSLATAIPESQNKTIPVSGRIETKLQASSLSGQLSPPQETAPLPIGMSVQPASAAERMPPQPESAAAKKVVPDIIDGLFLSNRPAVRTRAVEDVLPEPGRASTKHP